MTSRVRVHPTLAAMAEVYRLPREGGRDAPRFGPYTAAAAATWGLPFYNPMAGDHALVAVETLLAMDAERLTQECAERVVAVAAFDGTVDLAVIVASAGMWTDRVATEVNYRTVETRKPGYGMVYQWTRETPTREGLEREACAETLRVIWTSLHGPARTMQEVLHREGLAYAMAARCMTDPVPVERPSPDDSAAVEGALEVLGASEDAGEIAAVLFGDAVAEQMGWATLGIGDRAGYRWAIARAIDLQHLATTPVARAS
ncbi:MAG: hypothetical protein IT357_03125 [Gemmatimonadaceae bacterium]|nr:hypothetical protein [Gemmatimonadaceae bacterium]